jgi:zeta-carotene desaturase
VRLHEAGFTVTLLEKRNVLGGRASSFAPPGESASIDNCQHVLLGCCTNLLDFFSRTNALRHIRFYRRFDFLGERGFASLAASLLPAPLHFLPSILRFHHLSLGDRRSLARAIFSVVRTPKPYPDVSFMDWLSQQNQSTSLIECFWRPVMTSALNEDPERLSTSPAFHVIVDSFVRNRRGYYMGVPRVPLSEMYSGLKMREFMEIHLSTAISWIDIGDNRVAGIRLQGGERIEADYYLSALPPDALANLFDPQSLRAWPELEKGRRLEWSPITGIHLWYDRPVMSRPHAVIIGKTAQWVFNKSLTQSPGRSTGQYIQVVISASRPLLTMKREEILELIQRELNEVLPTTRGAILERAVVVKVAESTPHFPPGAYSQRPGAETPYRNLFLGGDWTATGWPPTMEGAVRSGYQAAECITAAAGTPRKFMVPDLPTGLLARLLLAGTKRPV